MNHKNENAFNALIQPSVMNNKHAWRKIINELQLSTL